MLLKSKYYPLIFVIVFMLFSASTYGFGRYAYGLFLPTIGQTYGIGSFELGLLASITTIVFICLTLLASMFAAYFSAMFLVFCTGFITALGFLIVCFAPSALYVVFGIVLCSAFVGVAPPAEYRVIDTYLTPKWQNRAIACLNAGGTLGILLVGFLSQITGGNWRITWLVFAAFCAILTIIALLLLPSRAEEVREIKPLNFSWEPRILQYSLKLLLCCLAYGISLGCYYTYATDLLTTIGVYSKDFADWFWVIVGISGLITVLSGDLITKIGVRYSIIASHFISGIAFLLIALGLKEPTLIITSAILFGIGSMVPGSALLIWSMRIFEGRPSLAFGVMFAFMSFGHAFGTSFTGYLSEALTLKHAFMMVPILLLLSLFALPSVAKMTTPTGLKES